VDGSEPDLGLFGPGSMAWRMHREPAMLLGGLRALIVQALHPLAMAAVVDFSDYESDVWGRYNRTSSYVNTTIFGTTAQALAAGRRVREVHGPIHGVDAVTGHPYAADDPTLLLWVHAVLIDSFVTAYVRLCRPLSDGDRDRYVAEMVRQAELVGLPAADVPASWQANVDFLDSLHGELRATPAAHRALRTVLRPPLPAWRRPFWSMIAAAALSITPEYALSMYGLRRPPLSDAVLRPSIRIFAATARRFLRPPPVIVAARRRAAEMGSRP
jgi:uncharacterized protein (DUF2236 family)